MPLIILTLAYLIGSFPTAFLLVFALRGQDIRRLGDCNMGAQNTWRQVSPCAGLIVGLVDGLKGALIILITRHFLPGQNWIFLAGLAGVTGHNWPIFAGFRGGRGEATTIGIFTILMPIPMLLAGVLGISTLGATHSVTRASAPLFIALPVFCWYLTHSPPIVAYSILLPCLVALTTFWRVRRRRVVRVT